ncbi:MAG: pilus assembly protein [Pseudomonadota bacterium]
MQKFARDETGAVVMFVLVIFLVMFVAAGMAVDFMRQEMARADLQNALDRGVLAATDVSQSVNTKAEAEAIISQYMGSRSYLEAPYTMSVTEFSNLGGRRVVAEASLGVNTVFLRALGYDALQVPVRSTAVEGAEDIEVVLVLDVSGSMGNPSTAFPGKTKLKAMQDAAVEFVETVLRGEGADRFLISIVPYSAQAAPPAWLADLYGINRWHSYGSCFDIDALDFTTTDMPTGGTYEQYQHFIERTETVDDVYRRVFGCPGPANHIVPFSATEKTLTDAIKGLREEFWTASYMGMRWAAALLDEDARPVVTRLITDETLNAKFAGWPRTWNGAGSQKIVILMTDGVNTRHNKIHDATYRRSEPVPVPAGGDGAALLDAGDGTPAPPFSGTDADYWDTHIPSDSERYSLINNESGATKGDGDDLLKDICDAMKFDVVDGVQVPRNTVIYTIGFELSDSVVAQDALADCASSASTAYLVEGLQISTAFAAIAAELQELRLTQ